MGTVRAAVVRRRSAITFMAAVVLAGMLLTAVRSGDLAGVLAVVLLASLVALALDSFGRRRWLPGFGGNTDWPIGLGLAAYVMIAGLLYGAGAQLLPPGHPPGQGPAHDPRQTGALQGTPALPRVTVTSTGEPQFIATVVGIGGPDRIIIDGDELIELDGVISVAADDPALSQVLDQAVSTLETLVLGRVVTVEVCNPGPPLPPIDPGRTPVWRAKVFVKRPADGLEVSVNEAVGQILSLPMARPSPGPNGGTQNGTGRSDDQGRGKGQTSPGNPPRRPPAKSE